MIPHDKLFIPGPVEVSEKTLAAFSRPMIGHRGEAFKNLYRDIHPKLQDIVRHKAASLSFHFIRLGGDGSLHPQSRRSRRALLHVRRLLRQMARCRQTCGKNAEPLQVEWGKHIDHKDVDAKLATGKFDTVTLIHNETSTGVMNPLPEICCTLAKYPDVALIVDTVSSFSAMKIDMDALGIDVMLTGSQKALALPPGFSLFSASEKAFARAEKQKDRGYYFDFLEFKKQQAEWMTPSTPSIGHIFALQSKLDEIFAEGLTNRYERHARTNALVHDWVAKKRLRFFRRGSVPLKDTHLREKQSGH